MLKKILRNKCSKKVILVKELTLTLRGMRGSTVYKIINEADKFELRLYREKFINGETVLELESSTVIDIYMFIEHMNKCGVISWDGFHGKHPRNVKDGIMFDFTAVVNDEQIISADGSENFPKGYHEFVRGLNNMFEIG